MLVHPWDGPVDEHEWREALRVLDFGLLIAPGGPERELPVVVPTHFLFDGNRTIELHLARPNPVWAAFEERPRAMLTVVGDYVYVPAEVNAGDDPTLGVPTSYYASVQAEVDVEVVDDPTAKAAILNRQLAHFEPAGSPRVPVDAHGADRWTARPGAGCWAGCPPMQTRPARRRPGCRRAGAPRATRPASSCRTWCRNRRSRCRRNRCHRRRPGASRDPGRRPPGPPRRPRRSPC